MSLDPHDVARFWSKVEVSAEGECWHWKGRICADGYGEFKLRSADQSCGSHRVAYVLFAGVDMASIDGLVVRHSCDQPSCCNPFHLLTGTHSDNVIDRVKRGRSAIGIGNGNHKLTEREVRAIRADGRPNAAIARLFGVHTDTVRLIKTGKTWRHLLAADNDNSPKDTASTATP